MWWVVPQYIANMQSDPNLRTQIPPMMADALQGGYQGDPIGMANQVWSQNDHTTALRLIEVAGVPSLRPDSWEDFFSQVKADYEALKRATGEVAEQRNEAVAAIEDDDVVGHRPAGELQYRRASRRQRDVAWIDTSR